MTFTVAAAASAAAAAVVKGRRRDTGTLGIGFAERSECRSKDVALDDDAPDEARKGGAAAGKAAGKEAARNRRARLRDSDIWARRAKGLCLCMCRWGWM